MTPIRPRIIFHPGVVACLVLFGAVVRSGAAQEPTPAELDSLFGRALISAQKDSVAEAVRVLKRVAKHHPEPARIYARIGRLNLKIQKADEAERAFRQAIQADNGLAEAHAGLGLVFLDLRGDWRRAIPPFRAALVRDSTDVETRYHLARAYAKGDRPEAKQIASRAIQMDPNYAPAYLLLAHTYEEEGLDDIALRYYQQYLQRHPKDQEVVYRFARRLAEAGREAESERLIERMDDPRSYAILAQISIRRGNYEDALLAFGEYIGRLSKEEQELYHDVSIVAQPREAAAYKATSSERRQEFLRRFWLNRDPLLASGGVMRRVEHYRRVLYARDHYGRKHYPWDRRGEVYIRYGEPDYRSTSRQINSQVPQAVQIIQTDLARRLYGQDGVGHTFVGPVYPVRTDRFINAIPEDPLTAFDDLPLLPHETSMQGRAGVAPEDTLGFYGYKPVTLGVAGMTVPWEVWFYTKIDGGIEVVFTDELGSGRYDYAPIPTLTSDDWKRFPDGPERLRTMQLFSDLAPETVMRGVVQGTPEAYDIGDLEAVNFHFDAVGFRGPDGKTDVRVFTGIPIRDLTVPDTGDTAVVERRVALIEKASGQVYRVHGDVMVPLSGNDEGVMVEEFPMAVTPGDYTLAVQVWRKGTKRMGVYHRPMPVESYAGAALMLSDVQVARKVAPVDSGRSGKFVRSGLLVRPSPGRTFYKGWPIFLYFEIYNLKRDASGVTHYEITYTARNANQTLLLIRALSGLGRLLAGGESQEAVTVHYEQKGSRNWEGDYVELGLGETAFGEHEVRVTVKDLNSGAEVSKTARFYIVEEKKAVAGP